MHVFQELRKYSRAMKVDGTATIDESIQLTFLHRLCT
jgi:hypothetical protein